MVVITFPERTLALSQTEKGPPKRPLSLWKKGWLYPLVFGEGLVMAVAQNTQHYDDRSSGHHWRSPRGSVLLLGLAFTDRAPRQVEAESGSSGIFPQIVSADLPRELRERW